MYTLIKRYILNPVSFQGKSRKDKTLLREEYKAEKTISTIRLTFYGIVFLQHIVKLVIIDSDLFHSLWASFLIFLFSIGVFIEIRLFGKEKIYKYYNSGIKYFYITADILCVSYLVYANYNPKLLTKYTNYTPEQFLPIIFLVLHVGFIVMGIFRFNPKACLYSGIISLISFLIMYKILLDYMNWKDYFIQYGKFNISFLVYIIVIFFLTTISSLISIRLKQVIIITQI